MRSKLTVFQGGVATSVRSGNTALAMTAELEASTALTELPMAVDSRREQIRAARIKGYEGDACGECGNFTLVRNGTCLKCDTCGSTTGCS